MKNKISRRQFLQVAGASAAALLLASCSGNSASSVSSSSVASSEAASSAAASSEATSTVTTTGKTLVVYFSATGTTQGVAQTIADTVPVLGGLVSDVTTDPSSGTIVLDARLPRTLAGLLAGGALGLAGALMQTLTRNPLADPGILGVNSGASFAIVLGAALFGFSSAQEQLLMAFCGALAASAVSRGRVAGDARGSDPQWRSRCESERQYPRVAGAHQQRAGYFTLRGTICR
mgnify:CR=1 FL=1